MPENFQLVLPDRELRRLGVRVQDDYQGALMDHSTRMKRFRRYYQKFRNRVDPPAMGDEDESNFSVPMVQWNVYAKWAQNLQALLGDDAEIVAAAVGPSDEKIVRKIGRYMTWRLFQSMGITNKLSLFEFRKILFGKTIAYCPWVTDRYWVKTGRSSTPKQEVWYDGPGFFPQWPDDILVPAEDADTIQDFSFVMRKYRATPQQLLDGEREGRYFGIKDSLNDIVAYSQQQRERDTEGEEIKLEKDEAEGVTYEGSTAVRHSLIVHEWYGRWRLPKGKRDSKEDNLTYREVDQSELVVRYLPDMQQVIGVQDLMDLYPRMRFRRPFVEASLVKDGSYWSPGFGELLESIEDEESANHNLFTTAGELSVGPVIFYKPGSGFDGARFRYQPYMAYPTDDPASVNSLNMKADLNYCVLKSQANQAIQEKVTGITDQTLGRAIERPNAPRTARGQLALIEQGNIRASLDTTHMREDMRGLVQHIWLLDSEFADKEVFFRVTEEDAGGLFDTVKGGSTMTAQERGGRFDFDIKFATSVWSREAKKQEQLQVFSLDLQNPLIMTNPRALWVVTDRLHRAFGDDAFAEVCPRPPDLDQPKPPAEEWALMQRGDDVEVNPMDNDDLHLVDHLRRLEGARKEKSFNRDPDAEARMLGHILGHQEQKRQKMVMQAMAQHLVQQIQANNQNPEQGGLNTTGGVPMPLAAAHSALGELIGQGQEPPGQGGPAGPAKPPNGAPSPMGQ